MTADNTNDLHRVRYIHEGVHDRLLNWARWCNGGRGSSSGQPMFRQYRSGYRESAEQVFIPIDGLDAVKMEKQVIFLPEKHRIAVQWFYVYSHRGLSMWKVLRFMGVQRDTLVTLVHDGRSMVKNRLDRHEHGSAIFPRKSDTASAGSASLREAEPTVSKSETITEAAL
jgi:hypothetical protein